MSIDISDIDKENMSYYFIIFYLGIVKTKNSQITINTI